MGRRIDERLWGEWRARLARYRQWGGSIGQFCEREGVTAATFYQWRRKLDEGSAEVSRQRRPMVETAPQFLAVRIEQAEPVELELPNGVKVRVPVGAGRTLEAVLAAAARCAAPPDGIAPTEAATC